MSILGQFIKWDLEDLCNVTDRGKAGVVVVTALDPVDRGNRVSAFPGKLGLGHMLFCSYLSNFIS